MVSPPESRMRQPMGSASLPAAGLTPGHSQVCRSLGGGLWVLNRGAGWGVCAGVGREA